MKDTMIERPIPYEDLYYTDEEKQNFMKDKINEILDDASPAFIRKLMVDRLRNGLIDAKSELLNKLRETLVKEGASISNELPSFEAGFPDFRVEGRSIELNMKVHGRAGYGINELDMFRWIPVECEIKDKEDTFIERYVICFLSQDLDLSTGNFHQLFWGDTQIWHNMLDGIEKGGEINPIPSKVDDGEFKGRYQLLFDPYNAFPIAARGWKIIKKESRFKNPWGLTLEQIGVEKIPEMNVFNENYDAGEYADFFIKLVKADIINKMKNQ